MGDETVAGALGAVLLILAAFFLAAMTLVLHGGTGLSVLVASVLAVVLFVSTLLSMFGGITLLVDDDTLDGLDPRTRR